MLLEIKFHAVSHLKCENMSACKSDKSGDSESRLSGLLEEELEFVLFDWFELLLL